MKYQMNWEEYSMSRQLGRNRLTLEHHREPLDDFLLFFSQIDTQKTILDIGCATGFFLAMLRELGFSHLTGIDISKSSCNHTKAKGFECFQINILTEEVKKLHRKYDIILLMDVLEHLTEPRDVLIRIRNFLLKDNGIVFITVPFYESFMDKYYRFRTGKSKLQQSIEHDPTHVQAFNLEPLINLIKEAGFRIMRCRRLGCAIPKVRTIRVKRAIEMCLPQWMKGTFLRLVITLNEIK